MTILRIFWAGENETLRPPVSVRLPVQLRLSEIILWLLWRQIITTSDQIARLGLHSNWEMRRNNSSAFPIENRFRGPWHGPWALLSRARLGVASSRERGQAPHGTSSCFGHKSNRSTTSDPKRNKQENLQRSVASSDCWLLEILQLTIFSFNCRPMKKY